MTNFFSVSSLQVVNYPLRLITVSYVVCIMGPGKYRLVNFDSAFMEYFTLLVTCVFDLSAIDEIA